MATLAPEIKLLKAEYEAMNLAEPKVVRGRPSQALQEFSRLFPEYVSLGGCAM